MLTLGFAELEEEKIIYLGCCPQLMIFVEEKESDTSQACMLKGNGHKSQKKSSDSINVMKWGKDFIMSV